MSEIESQIAPQTPEADQQQQQHTVRFLKDRRGDRYRVLVDGQEYIKSSRKPRVKVDRREYMRSYRLKRKRKMAQLEEKVKELGS